MEAPHSPGKSKSTSLFLYHVLVSEMILGRNMFDIIYYFQASVSIRSRYILYIDDCVSTTKPSNPIRRVMQRNNVQTLAMIAPFLRSVVAEWI